jgi:hypothetical protein
VIYRLRSVNDSASDLAKSRPSRILFSYPARLITHTPTSRSALHIFGFPLLLLVPSAPLSSAVGSVSEVSAFKLTGSPSIVGLVLSFSSAFCLRVCFSPPLLSPKAPVSSGVGLVSEVSALRDTGSPIWVGFSLARSLRDFLLLLLFCGCGVSLLGLVWETLGVFGCSTY